MGKCIGKRLFLNMNGLLTCSELRQCVQAMKLYGVTYDTPPRGELFEDFHTKQPDRDLRRAQSAPPSSATTTNSFPEQLAMMMVMAKTVMAAEREKSAEPESCSRKRKLDVAESSETYSSDLEDMIYPELAVFIDDLANKHSHRSLFTFKEDLQANNFYRLNDLKGKEETYFTEHPFFLSKGNASFIVNEVKHAIRKVEKRAGRG